MNKIKKLMELEKAARDFGFNYPSTNHIIDQLISECEEVRVELGKEDREEELKKEIGDCIHTAFSLCGMLGFDPEDIIDITIKKFGSRMEELYKLAKENGYENFHNATLEDMLSLWKQTKINVG